MKIAYYKTSGNDDYDSDIGKEDLIIGEQESYLNESKHIIKDQFNEIGDINLQWTHVIIRQIGN